MTVDQAILADLCDSEAFVKFNLKIQKGKKINKQKLLDLLTQMDEPMQQLALRILSSSAKIYKNSQMKPKRGIGSY